MEGQNFFVYSDENDGIKCLYRYYTRYTYNNKYSLAAYPTVFYKFIMGNKLEVVGSKVKL